MNRIIKPEEVQVGDTIRISLTFNEDMKVTREGKVRGASAGLYGTESHALLLDARDPHQTDVVVELLDRPMTLPCEIDWDGVRVNDKIQVDFKDGSITGTVADVHENIFLDITGIDIEILRGDPEKITLLEREGL